MSDELVVGLMGVGGVVVGSVLQWLIARFVVRSENERLHRQLRMEFNHQSYAEWQKQLSETLAELLSATDPEAARPFQQAKIVPLVLKAQMMLNPAIATQSQLNSVINEVALKVNGWHGEQDLSSLLSAHNRLLEAARNALYRHNPQQHG